MFSAFHLKTIKTRQLIPRYFKRQLWSANTSHDKLTSLLYSGTFVTGSILLARLLFRFERKAIATSPLSIPLHLIGLFLRYAPLSTYRVHEVNQSHCNPRQSSWSAQFKRDRLITFSASAPHPLSRISLIVWFSLIDVSVRALFGHVTLCVIYNPAILQLQNVRLSFVHRWLPRNPLGEYSLCTCSL